MIHNKKYYLHKLFLNSLNNGDFISINKIYHTKNKKGVYVLLDESLNIVYIGMSCVSIFKRLKAHLKTKHYFFFSFLEIQKNKDIINTERSLIKCYKPKYNTQYC
jgi:excinuclease UvrABC nuclease subunit